MPPSCPSRRVQRARTSAGTLAAPKRLVPASPGVRLAPPPYHLHRVHSRFEPYDRSRRSRPFGSTMPLVDSRSALVVLHHRDGFLRDPGRELVASRCRPWGSSRFPASRARLHLLVGLRRGRWGAAWNTIAVLATLTPFEESPSPAAVPRHRGRCLLAVFRSSPACIQRSCDRCSSAHAPEGRGCRRDPTLLTSEEARVGREPVERAHARP